MVTRNSLASSVPRRDPLEMADQYRNLFYFFSWAMLLIRAPGGCTKCNPDETSTHHGICVIQAATTADIVLFLWRGGGGGGPDLGWLQVAAVAGLRGGVLAV